MTRIPARTTPPSPAAWTLLVLALAPALLLCCLPGTVSADTTSPRLAPYREQVDAAVDRALAWLAKVQQKDGSFPGGQGQTNAVVGLSAMAFLSKGYTPGHEPYGDVINRCIDYVLAHQRENGSLDTGNGGGGMYSHCISTLLLSESSGMLDAERQKKADVVLPRALRVILAAQQVRKPPVHQGGWRYSPDSTDSDISISGWALMALRSARLNGAPVPNQAVAEAVKFLERCRNKDGGFAYTPGSGSGVARTGVGLLCLELAGQHGKEITTKAGDYILARIRPGQFFQDAHFHYALYYSAQGMFQLGGDYWDKFAEAMYKFVLPAQTPEGMWRSGNETAYATAMTVLALTVEYRQLPIYQR